MFSIASKMGLVLVKIFGEYKYKSLLLSSLINSNKQTSIQVQNQEKCLLPFM